MIKKFIHIVAFVCLNFNSFSQSGIVSEIELTDTKRIEQLTDSTFSVNLSFLIRSSSQYNSLLQVSNKKTKWPQVKLLHTTYSVQQNSKLSFGGNDGNFYPNVGLQQRASVGVGIKWWKLSIELSPEWVSANNKTPEPFSTDPLYGNYWPKYYTYIVNKVDMLNRFGTEPLEKFFYGQSSVRFNSNNISFGVSNENLWWGPGLRNSLVMTNNAPGFLHVSLNTIKPKKTVIGSFEGQIIIGKLDSTGFENPDNPIMNTIWPGGIAKKLNYDRMINGVVFTWQPIWIKNFYIGFANTTQWYVNDSLPLGRYIPVIFPFSLSKGKPRMKLGSIFLRYALPRDNAEFYFEFGRADKAANPVNLFADTIPIGYVAGIRKLFPLAKRNQFIQFMIEVTQLQLSDSRLVIDEKNVWGPGRTKSWYMDRYIQQGYSNAGQLMGAAIGPGSNSQTINVAWVNKLKKIGIQLERIIYNKDFYYFNYFNGELYNTMSQGANNKHWVDLVVNAHVQWDYKQVVFSASYNSMKSLNYRWIKLDGGWQEPSTLSDRKNQSLAFSIRYGL